MGCRNARSSASRGAKSTRRYAAAIRPFHEFDEANATWPRGARLEAIRSAAEDFRERFKAQGRVRGVRTVDLVSAGYPTRYAFGGAARGSVNPYINILNRLVVVQFEDFDGHLKILCWEPTVPEGSSEAPFYAQLIERYGERLSKSLLSNEYNTVTSALATCGLAPEDVDFVSFDHLHVQDMRILMGTTQPVEGEMEPRAPFFPNAKFVCQSKEVDTFRSPHPMQWAWYVPGGMDHVIEDDLVLVDGDVELGVGRRAGVDAGPYRRQPVAGAEHRGRRVGLLGERRGGGQLAPAHVQDPGPAARGRVHGPRGDPELEHAGGLDRPVRLDGEGEGARRPQPRRPPLDERVSLERAARVEAPMAGGARASATAASTTARS